MNKAIQAKVSALSPEQQKDTMQFAFASESGQMALEIIARGCYHYESAVTVCIGTDGKVDPFMMARVNGMQDAVKYILSMLERDTANLAPEVPGEAPGAPSE